MKQTVNVMCVVLLLSSLNAFTCEIRANRSNFFSARNLSLQSRYTNLHDIEGMEVRRIEFSGKVITKDYVVRRLFVMREGEPFRRYILHRSIRRLNESGLFERMSERDLIWRVVEEDGPYVNLLITIKERGPRKRLLYLMGRRVGAKGGHLTTASTGLASRMPLISMAHARRLCQSLGVFH